MTHMYTFVLIEIFRNRINDNVSFLLKAKLAHAREEQFVTTTALNRVVTQHSSAILSSVRSRFLF